MTSISRQQSQSQSQQQQPAIVIDPSVKESIYSMIEAQRHSHELVVTQLMVALEETHRECRFLRQQLSTSNEMLQDSQLQLRRAVDDKEALLAKIASGDRDAARLREENDELKQRVQEDVKELAEVREMVKNAMEETYRSRAAIQQYNNSNNTNDSNNNNASPSRQMLNTNTKNTTSPTNIQHPEEYYSPVQQQQQQQRAYQGYGSSDYPASHQAIKAGVAFGAVSPPRVRDDTGGVTTTSEVIQQQQHQQTRHHHHQDASSIDLSVNRNSTGELTVIAENNNNNRFRSYEQQYQPNTNPALISSTIMNSSSNSNTNVAASIPRSMLVSNQQQDNNNNNNRSSSSGAGGAAPVSISYKNNNAESQQIFRPITVDMNLSRAVSVSSQGHVAISVGNEDLGEAALCCYRDLRSSSSSTVRGGFTLIFEASFRSVDPKSVLVGLATVLKKDSNDRSRSNDNNNISSSLEPTSSSSFSQVISASSGLGARCAMRGDGMLLLATSDGNVFEARSGLSVVTSSSSSSSTQNGVITVRLEEMTSRVSFAVNGDVIHTAPLQVPRSISGAEQGYLVPFVSLPCNGDEVVVRAPNP